MKIFHNYNVQREIRRDSRQRDAEILVYEVLMSPTEFSNHAQYLRTARDNESSGPVDRFLRHRAILGSLDQSESYGGYDNMFQLVNYGDEVKGDFDSLRRRAVTGLIIGAVAVGVIASIKG